MKKLDLNGKVFGRLTVIKISVNKTNRIHWDCKCSCGNTVAVSRDNLVNGKATSCGCFRRGVKGNAGFIALFNDYKYSAKRRGLIFNLTKDEFSLLTTDKCTYCGSEPYNISNAHFPNISNHTKINGAYVYNGIDRVDNSVGYILSNCATCCRQCNSAKKNLTLLEFKDWIFRIYHYTYRNEGSIQKS